MSRSFELLPDRLASLALAGAPDGFGAAEELQAVEQSPARNRIDVMGYVSSSQLEILYASAGIFAPSRPSTEKGFGMPILEAMAHGVPVLTSNCSAMPEVAGDAAILVDPKNIGDALLNLAERRTAARRSDTPRSREDQTVNLQDLAVEKTWAVYDELR